MKKKKKKMWWKLKKKRPTPFQDKNSCRLDQKLLNKLKKESTPPPKVWFLPFFYRLLHYTHTHTRNRSWKHIENTTFFFFSSWKSWWIKNWLVTQCPRSAAIIKQQQLFCILYRLLFCFLNLFYLPWLRITAFLFLSCKKKKKKKNIYAYLQTESSSLKLYERQLHLSLADRFNFENKNKLDDFPSWFRRVASSVRF